MKISKFASLAIMGMITITAFANANNEKLEAVKVIEDSLTALLKDNVKPDKYGSVSESANFNNLGLTDTIKKLIPAVEKLGIKDKTFNLGTFDGENIDVVLGNNRIVLRSTKDNRVTEDVISLDQDNVVYTSRKIKDYLYDDDTITTTHKSEANSKINEAVTNSSGAEVLTSINEKILKALNPSVTEGSEYPNKIDSIINGDFSGIAKGDTKEDTIANVNTLLNGVKGNADLNRAVNSVFDRMKEVGFKANQNDPLKVYLDDNKKDGYYITFIKKDNNDLEINIGTSSTGDAIVDKFVRAHDSLDFTYSTNAGTLNHEAKSAISKLEAESTDFFKNFVNSKHEDVEDRKGIVTLEVDRIFSDDISYSTLTDTAAADKMFKENKSTIMKATTDVLKKIKDSNIATPITIDIANVSGVTGAKIVLEKEGNNAKIKFQKDVGLEDTFILENSKEYSNYTANDTPVLPEWDGKKSEIAAAVNKYIADKKMEYEKKDTTKRYIEEKVAPNIDTILSEDYSSVNSAEELKNFIYSGTKNKLASDIEKLTDGSIKVSNLEISTNLVAEIASSGKENYYYLKISKKDHPEKYIKFTPIEALSGDTSSCSGTDCPTLKMEVEGDNVKEILTDLTTDKNTISTKVKDTSTLTTELSSLKPVNDLFNTIADENINMIFKDSYTGDKATLETAINANDINAVNRAAKKQIMGILKVASGLEDGKKVNIKINTNKDVIFTLEKENGKGKITISSTTLDQKDFIKQLDDDNFTFSTEGSSVGSLISTLTNSEVLTKLEKERRKDNFLLDIYKNSELSAQLENIINIDYSKISNTHAGSNLFKKDSVAPLAQTESMKKVIDVLKAVDTEDIVIDNITGLDGVSVTLSKTEGIKVTKEANSDTFNINEEGELVFNTTTDTPVIATIDSGDKAKIVTAINDKFQKAYEKLYSDTLGNELKEFVKAYTSDNVNEDIIKEKASAIITKIDSNDKLKTAITAMGKTIDLGNNYTLSVKNSGEISITDSHKTDIFRKSDSGIEVISSKSTDNPIIKKLVDENSMAEKNREIIAILEDLKEDLKIDPVVDKASADKAQADIKKIEDELKEGKLSSEERVKKERTLNKIKEKVADSSVAVQTIKDELKAALSGDDDGVKTEVKKKLQSVVTQRANAISDVSNLGENKSKVIKAIASVVLDSSEALDILSEEGVKGIAQKVSQIEKSVENTAKNSSKNISTDVIKFNSDLATYTRLAKLTNPYNDDLALAYAINNLKNDPVAAQVFDFTNVVKNYTDRYKNDNNLWGNVIAGKGKVAKAGKPSIYGVTLGYDKLIDDVIFGGFIGYSENKVSDTDMSSKSDNVNLGLYTRYYVDNFEIDTKYNFTLGNNKNKRSSLGKEYKSNFKSYYHNLNVDYGNIIPLRSDVFVKPIVGVELAWSKTDDFKESGELGFNYKGQDTKTLSAKLAAEARVYNPEGNYIYAVVGVQQELLKSSDKLQASLNNSKEVLTFKSKNSKSTYAITQLGGEYKINDNLSLNANIGTKLSKDNKFYAGTLGFKYKF